MRSLVVALMLAAIFSVLRLAQTDPQAPGRLIDVGGWRMHINCTGAARPGQPTVILEAGSSDFSIDWAFVQPEVALFSRACSYDARAMMSRQGGPRVSRQQEEPEAGQQKRRRHLKRHPGAGVRGFALEEKPWTTSRS